MQRHLDSVHLIPRFYGQTSTAPDADGNFLSGSSISLLYQTMRDNPKSAYIATQARLPEIIVDILTNTDSEVVHFPSIASLKLERGDESTSHHQALSTPPGL